MENFVCKVLFYWILLYSTKLNVNIGTELVWATMKSTETKVVHMSEDYVDIINRVISVLNFHLLLRGKFFTTEVHFK